MHEKKSRLLPAFRKHGSNYVYTVQLSLCGASSPVYNLCCPSVLMNAAAIEVRRYPHGELNASTPKIIRSGKNQLAGSSYLTSASLIKFKLKFSAKATLCQLFCHKFLRTECTDSISAELVSHLPARGCRSTDVQYLQPFSCPCQYARSHPNVLIPFS